MILYDAMQTCLGLFARNCYFDFGSCFHFYFEKFLAEVVTSGSCFTSEMVKVSSKTRCRLLKTEKVILKGFRYAISNSCRQQQNENFVRLLLKMRF